MTYQKGCRGHLDICDEAWRAAPFGNTMTAFCVYPASQVSLCHLVESLAVCYFAISNTEQREHVSYRFYFQLNNKLIQGNFSFFGPTISLFSFTNIFYFIFF